MIITNLAWTCIYNHWGKDFHLNIVENQGQARNEIWPSFQKSISSQAKRIEWLMRETTEAYTPHGQFAPVLGG